MFFLRIVICESTSKFELILPVLPTKPVNLMEKVTEAIKDLGVSIKDSASVSGTEDTAGPSKNAVKKAAKEAEKAKKKAETAAKLAAQKTSMQGDSIDVSEGKYGVFPLIQSTTRTGNCHVENVIDFLGEKRSRIAGISAALEGTEISLRARVHNIRLQGCSLVLFLSNRLKDDLFRTSSAGRYCAGTSRSVKRDQ
jgi:hypothetical protein